MHELLETLLSLEGSYEGRGRNHADEPFTGRLVLEPAAGGAGVQIRFHAEGDDGTVYHVERTLIGPKTDGSVALWTTSTHAPSFAEYALRDDASAEGARHVVFGHGERGDATVYRSEIRIVLPADGTALEYHHAWGLPDGPFDERSGVRLERVV